MVEGGPRRVIYDLFSVEEKRVLVTGGSAGLGRAMAEALSAGGASVAIVGRSRRVFDVAETMGALPIQADLSVREQAQGLIGQAVSMLGGLDVLVNGAGTQRRHAPEVFPLDDWDHVLAVNLDAVWMLAQQAGQIMLSSGGGKIINIASAQSFLGGVTIPAYAASKGAIAQLTKALSNDWAGRGINVNAIAPGYMATEMTAALVGNPEREPMILSRIPAGRWGRPDDLQGVTLFLSSSASDYVHGAIIAVDGGFLGRKAVVAPGTNRRKAVLEAGKAWAGEYNLSASAVEGLWR